MILRERYFPAAKRNVEAKASVEKIMLGFVRYQRANNSVVTIKDEPDRYVVTYDPCGSGGFLIKNRPELIPEEYFSRIGKAKTIKHIS